MFRDNMTQLQRDFPLTKGYNFDSRFIHAIFLCYRIIQWYYGIDIFVLPCVLSVSMHIYTHIS